MSHDPRRPRAFRLDAGEAVIEERPDPYARENEAGADATALVRGAQARGVAARFLTSWGGLFWSAASGLALLMVGSWIIAFLDSLAARSPALGVAGVALASLAALALTGMAAREARGVLRQRGVARLHAGFAEARARDDRDAARLLAARLIALYADRPDTARARAHLDDLTGEIVDGRDLIDIAERELMQPLDARVTREIAAAAKRVSVVTAISPRAIVDLAFVAAQSLRLVRRIAEIYGGRPGSLGFLRILRSVGAHLAITGGMAAGESIVQQALGHGIAARLSARLGEGVLNGLLTARVGLSAMAVCRPMPFAIKEAPGLAQVAPALFGGKEKAAAATHDPPGREIS